MKVLHDFFESFFIFDLLLTEHVPGLFSCDVEPVYFVWWELLRGLFNTAVNSRFYPSLF